MKPAALLGLLALVGAAGYLAWRALSQPRAPDPTLSAAPAGRYGSLGQALGAVPLVGPFAAAAGGVVDSYNALPPEQQAQIKGWSGKISQTVARSPFGPVVHLLSGHGDALTASRKRNDQLRGIVGAAEDEVRGADTHARAIAAALSRPDVTKWSFGQEGQLNVWYGTRADPWTLYVPPQATNPAAWAAEWATRVFGRWVQAGNGPVRAQLPELEAEGFSPNNPYAPIQYREFELDKKLDPIPRIRQAVTVKSSTLIALGLLAVAAYAVWCHSARRPLNHPASEASSDDTPGIW